MQIHTGDRAEQGAADSPASETQIVWERQEFDTSEEALTAHNSEQVKQYTYIQLLKRISSLSLSP